jgi:hypothetical protein
MEQPGSERSLSPWSWWPNMAGGLLWPFLTMFLRRAMPIYLAAALSFAVLFALAGLVYQTSPPSAGWTLSKWLVATAVGAIVVGVFTFFFSWS